VVASTPSGGSDGRKMPSRPSPQALASTSRMAASVSVERMKATSTQFTSSSVREIFRPNSVMTNTTAISSTASQFVAVASSSPGMSPVTNVNSPSPAAAAQPPVMNAR
jgi:hypothetical protein